jgi:hypothetical protein
MAFWPLPRPSSCGGRDGDPSEALDSFSAAAGAQTASRPNRTSGDGRAQGRNLTLVSLARRVMMWARASWPSVLKPAYSSATCFAAQRLGRRLHAALWSAERSPAPSCRGCPQYFPQPHLRSRPAPSMLPWHHRPAFEVRNFLRRVGNRYVPTLGDHFRPCGYLNLPCSPQGRW